MKRANPLHLIITVLIILAILQGLVSNSFCQQSDKDSNSLFPDGRVMFQMGLRANVSNLYLKNNFYDEFTPDSLKIKSNEKLSPIDYGIEMTWTWYSSDINSGRKGSNLGIAVNSGISVFQIGTSESITDTAGTRYEYNTQLSYLGFGLGTALAFYSGKHWSLSNRSLILQIGTGMNMNFFLSRKALVSTKEMDDGMDPAQNFYFSIPLILQASLGSFYAKFETAFGISDLISSNDSSKLLKGNYYSITIGTKFFLN